MPVDSAAHIGNFDATKPTGSEVKSEGDDNLRHIKSVLKTDFAYITGPVTATHTELNYVAGVTSAIQTQLNTKGAITGQTWTGTHSFTGATVTVAEPSANSHPATKLYADSLAFAAAVPAMSSSTQDKVVTNNGTTARWDDAGLTAQSLFFASF